MLTTNKVATGEFEVLWNGEATGYSIFNAYAGMSGRGANFYVIRKPDGARVNAGSLARAKKTLALTFKNNPPVVGGWEVDESDPDGSKADAALLARCKPTILRKFIGGAA